jgi:hypothetical protein
MAVESPPFAVQAGTFGAEQTRRAISNLLTRGSTVGSITGGLLAASDCQVTAGSGMQVNVSTGEAWVPGTSSATQGGYYSRVSSTSALSISASDPTNPRIDRVVAQTTDAAYSGVTNTFAVAVVTGTPTAGATLTNLSGAGAVPASSLLLANVLVPAGSSSVTNANIANVAALATTSLGDQAVSSVSGTVTAVSGNAYEAAASTTITLPTPVKNSTVTIIAGTAVTSSTPVTVNAGATGKINGPGLSSASSFVLGQPGAFTMLLADGSNWFVIAGQQDTGWVTLTAPSGWTNGAGTVYYTAAYRLVGDTVRLRGPFTNQTGSTAGFSTTIPAAIVPAKTVLWVAYANSGVVWVSVGQSAPNSFSCQSLVTNGSSVFFDGASYPLS